MRGALDFPDGDEAQAEIVRVEHGRPRYGVDLDDSVIPQEAGLNERAVSFTKGCYVGQETVARLLYRGKPNRRLLGLRLAEPASRGASSSWARRWSASSARWSSRPSTGRSAWRSSGARPTRVTRWPWKGRRRSSWKSPSRGNVRCSRTSEEGSCPMAAHVIVLANRTAAAPELIEALVHRSERGPIHATLVMPAAGPGSADRAAARSGSTRPWTPGVQRGSSSARASSAIPCRWRRCPRSGTRCATTRRSSARCRASPRSGCAATSPTPSPATPASRSCTSSPTTRRTSRTPAPRRRTRRPRSAR